MADNKIIEVKDLVISFKTINGKVQAVRNINFHLDKGETLCIVGESGSGKSVTCRAMMGILAGNSIIENGSILYKGIDLVKTKEEDFHKLRGADLGMIFQDPMSSLNPIMKIGYQIREAVIENRYKALKAELGKYEKGSDDYKVIKDEMSRYKIKAYAKNKTLSLMEEVGIPDAEKRYYQYPFQFSGGMRQRIVIAIALAANPHVLICDEPTTALDVTIQSQILELINRLKVERQLSVIFITHDLGVVANMADRIAIMYAGKIVEYGLCDEIFYSPEHPYTWALLSSMPSIATETGQKLDAIPGTPPNMIYPPKGDAFAARNKYAMQIDLEEEPPFFKVSDTHYAATWLLHENAPKIEKPVFVRFSENDEVRK